MVTVKQLIEILQQCNPDDVVIISKDAEGNDYSPLIDEISDGVYVPNSTWSGEVHLLELTDELRNSGFTEDDVWEVGEQDAVKCITLWPTN